MISAHQMDQLNIYVSLGYQETQCSDFFTVMCMETGCDELWYTATHYCE